LVLLENVKFLTGKMRMVMVTVYTGALRFWEIMKASILYWKKKKKKDLSHYIITGSGFVHVLYGDHIEMALICELYSLYRNEESFC